MALFDNLECQSTRPKSLDATTTLLLHLSVVVIVVIIIIRWLQHEKFANGGLKDVIVHIIGIARVVVGGSRGGRDEVE